MPTDIVPVNDPKRPGWVLTRVDALVKVVKESYVELTELLWEIKTKEHFRKLKGKDGEAFDRFEDYVEDRLGWKDRKAEYFISIHEKLTLAGAPKKTLATIEWSKASQLTALPEAERQPGKIEGWLEKAQNMKFLDLKAEVVNARTTGKEKKEPFTPIQFLLTKEQKDNIELALTNAGKVGASDKKGHLLDCICTEFNQARNESGAIKLTRILQSVERVYDVQIVAVKIKGDDTEIVYGQKFAKKYGIE